MTAFEQNPVSAVVWPWPKKGEKPTAKKDNVIQRALIQAVIAGVIGLIVYFRHHHIVGTVVLVLAGWTLFSGLFVPKAFLVVEKWMKKFAAAVGTALTWILLVPFFYIVFVPARALLILFHKDPLHLKFSPEASTYWTPRRQVSIEQFKRQY